MREVTIITAFFDIGRDKYNFYSRSVDKYLDYFEFWARIENKLIVYTSPELATRVMDVRRKFGLAHKTVVVEIHDVFAIESELYKKMKAIERKPDFLKFRANSNPEWPENMANYNYVMLMKYWCIQDAVSKNLAKGLLAWIDFGFNHGGSCFINPNEFSFKWNCELGDRIHLFSINNPDKILSVFNLQLLSVSIMGAPLILPDTLANELWYLIRKATEALLMLDCIDDDQQLLLMAYRENPDIFQIHLSDWFMPIKEFGGHHLATKPKVKQKVSFLTKIKSNFLAKKRRYEFCKRMYEEAKKYQI